MPKPSLKEPYQTLESEIIDTLIAGHKEWRSDLDFPESRSDMQGAVRGLLRMFDVKRRPIALPIKEMIAESELYNAHRNACPNCRCDLGANEDARG